ncbi:MAG: SRPBCC family protein [Anaerolineales bacterium]
MPNTSFQIQTHIHATPEIIFPYIADLTKHSEWSANPIHIEALTEPVPAVGNRYRSSAEVNGLRFHAELEVTEYQAPTVFAFSGIDETGRFEHRFTLRLSGAGTLVTRQVLFNLTVKQWLRYLLLLYPVRLPAARKALGLLKKHIEGQHP